MTCKLKKRDTIGVIINYIDKYGLKIALAVKSKGL